MPKNKVRNFLFIMVCIASFSACLFININAKSLSSPLSNVKVSVSQEDKVVLPDVEVFMHMTKKVKEVISLLPTK